MADVKLLLVGLCLVAGVFSPSASASSTRPTTSTTIVSSSTTNTANVTATTLSLPLSHTRSVAINNSDSTSLVPTTPVFEPPATPGQTANPNVTSDNGTFTPNTSTATTSASDVQSGSNGTLSTLSVSPSMSATAATNFSSTSSIPVIGSNVTSPLQSSSVPTTSTTINQTTITVSTRQTDNSSSTNESDHQTFNHTTATTYRSTTVPSINASVTIEPHKNFTTSTAVSGATSENVNDSINKTTVTNNPTSTANESSMVTTSSANVTTVTETPTSTEETTFKNDTGFNTTDVLNTTSTLSPSTSISTPSIFNGTTYSTANTSATTNASVSMTTPSVLNVTGSDVDNVTGTDLGNFTSTATGNMTSAENNTSTKAQLPGNTTVSVVTGVGPVTRTTTHKPWEPPDQTGTFGPDSSNLTIILIPCLAILILSVIAILIFIMCKRARKNARRTRAPEAQKKTSGTATQYGTGSPFITSPYRSGEDPRTAGNAGHENLAYERDDPKSDPKIIHEGNADKRYKNGDVKKEISTSDKKQADQPHLARYDRLKDEESSNPQNGLHNTVKFEKMKTEDDDIELGNIVIESDPDDSNRYFKKADLGDWYRLVMKGKRPKDTETLLDKNETGDKGSKHGKDKHRQEREKHRGDKEKHKTHSSQEEKSDEYGRREHRRKSRDKYDTKDRSKSPHKRHHKSSERELSSSLPKPSSSNGKGKERLAASLPLDMSSSKIQNLSKSGHTSPIKMAQPPQSKLIMSNPVIKDTNASHDKSEAKGDQSKTDTKDAAVSQAAVPKTRLIMSQPKAATRAFPDGKASETGRTVDIVADDKKKAPVNISQDTASDGKTAAKSQSQRRPEIVPRLNLTKS